MVKTKAFLELRAASGCLGFRVCDASARKSRSSNKNTTDRRLGFRV